MDPRPSPPRKPWGRRPGPTALESALEDLGRVVAERPELAAPGRALADVLRAAFPEPAGESDVAGSPDIGALLLAWGEGTPAFRRQAPALDGVRIRRRGVAVCRALRPHYPGTGAGALRSALRSRRVDLRDCWLAGNAGDPEAVDRRADALGLDRGLLLAVLRLAVLPDLARASGPLTPMLPEGLWRRGDCPCCGQRPALAESRGLERRRRLRCGWCAADWAGDRLRCPSCDADDHRLLHYRYVDGEQERLRLSLCDRCGARLKVVSTLTPLSAPGLLVTELATVHLDLIGEGDADTDAVPDGPPRGD